MAIKPKKTEKKSKSKEVAVKKNKDITKAPKQKKEVVTAKEWKLTSKFPMATGETIDQTISEFTAFALKTYGSYVVEQRAVPDFRDGLKPVHRAVLWSMAGLLLRPDKPYKKSARTIGDTIGMYHPHGDSAAYDAMVTITNALPPFVDGQGGFGSPSTPASAQRYTEAKMSRFTNTFLLDPDYLKVVPMEMNFSNDQQIPLYLPALLPSLLFITNIPAPAYGVKCGNPAFSLKSVAKVVVDMLRGKTYTGKKLSDTLEVKHPYGCIDVSKDSDIETLMETGKGNVTYAPLTHTDIPKRTIYLQSHVPMTLASVESINKTLNKIMDIDGVKNAENTPGKKGKNAGPFGALCAVECPKNLDEDRFDEICHKVDGIVKSSVNYRLGITIRRAGTTANEFRYLNYVDFFTGWIKYRINLEERMIAYKLDYNEKHLHLNEVYLFGISNLKELLKVLPKILMAKDPDVALAKHFKIPVENAKIILDRKIRQLSKMDADALKEKIKGFKDEIKILKADAKDPGSRAARDTEERMKKYMKNPDIAHSGLPI
jgi:DNA gyrase/topoisomerase IV subunit A